MYVHNYLIVRQSLYISVCTLQQVMDMRMNARVHVCMGKFDVCRIYEDVTI